MPTADLSKLAATADQLRQVVQEASENWPRPTDIKADMPPAPVFDGPTLLPKPLCEFVLDEADRMPCSPDYVAAALIVALGSVIGARTAIKPKRRDDWIVTPNLFGGVVGDPSSKKTPAINTVLRFLDRLEARESDRHTERMKVHEAEMAAFSARQAAIQSVMKKAASGKGDGLKMDLAVADLQSLEPPEEPRQRRFKTNDGTVAKIGDILVGSPAGLMVFRDELVGLLASWDREGNEGDRAFYLEGFNGTGSFNIDRVGRGSLFVKTVCLSVFGGIQPELLERYLAGMVSSLDNDGRFQRFQVLVYPEPVAWQWRDRYVTDLDSDGGSNNDKRCWNHGGKCYNDEEKQLLAEHIVGALGAFIADGQRAEAAKAVLRNKKLRGLIEFSRSIHAEMHALLTALRQTGPLVRGGRLYVTTYPCHSCARHIVAAGIRVVYYIEPYKKSLATKLHGDAVTEKDQDMERVRFLPYDGVAPSRYLALFRMAPDSRKKDGRVIRVAPNTARPKLEKSLEALPALESRLRSSEHAAA